MAQSNEQVAAAVLETKMYSQLRHANLVPLKDSLRKTDPALPNQTDFYLLFPYFEVLCTMSHYLGFICLPLSPH
jgi:hypothetical protein